MRPYRRFSHRQRSRWPENEEYQRWGRCRKTSFRLTSFLWHLPGIWQVAGDLFIWAPFADSAMGPPDSPDFIIVFMIFPGFFVIIGARSLYECSICYSTPGHRAGDYLYAPKRRDRRRTHYEKL
jgi:hypothetical protein